MLNLPGNYTFAVPPRLEGRPPAQPACPRAGPAHDTEATVDDEGGRCQVRVVVAGPSGPARAGLAVALESTEQGVLGGCVTFGGHDYSEEAGPVGIPTKAPGVALVDLDNDGWPDLVTSASADDGAGPAICRHSGELDGVPRFIAPSGVGDPQYWIGGPVADVERDGRMDLCLVEWEPSRPSLLLRNTSNAGHWLEVSVGPELGGGPGTRVAAYETGAAGEVDRLVASAEITASEGYTSDSELIAHLGLGAQSQVDVVVSPPDQAEIVLTDIPADRHLRLPEGC